MSDQDKPSVGGHEQPPPRPVPPPLVKGFAAAAVAFDLATVIALSLGRCDLATILAILALLFGGLTLGHLMIASSDQDKPSVGGHEQPPP